MIPILIDHARMPGEADLPSSLSRLAFRNAVEVDQGRDFHPHVDRLIRGIEFHFQKLVSVPAKQAGEATIRSTEPEPTTSSPVNKLTNSLGLRLVRVEPGEFLMGTTKDQVDHLIRLFPDSERDWFDDEQPQHPVRISQPFFLGIHQVTQRQYQAVMGNNPSHFKGSDELPVENVTWFEAVQFCNKLSEREKQTPFYRINGDAVTTAGGNGYRLPTEAEWEYACRAQSTTLYPFGDDASQLDEHAWHANNSGKLTHPVGQKRPNVWGLYDMLGNVWEWCADWYASMYYASSPPTDPPGAGVTARRVIRGGSWINYPHNCRSADRLRNEPQYRNRVLGFRVARVRG